MKQRKNVPCFGVLIIISLFSIVISLSSCNNSKKQTTTQTATTSSTLQTTSSTLQTAITILETNTMSTTQMSTAQSATKSSIAKKKQINEITKQKPTPIVQKTEPNPYEGLNTENELYYVNGKFQYRNMIFSSNMSKVKKILPSLRIFSKLTLINNRYYFDMMKNDRILYYSCKTDGTDIRDEFVPVNQSFYYDNYYYRLEDSSLIRQKIDSTNSETKLTLKNIITFNRSVLSGDYLYASAWTSPTRDSEAIIKVSLKDFSYKILKKFDKHKMFINLFACHDKWLYFSNSTGIDRISIDGTTTKDVWKYPKDILISSDPAMNNHMIYKGKAIYISGHDFLVWDISKQNLIRKKITYAANFIAGVHNDWLYYVCYNSNGGLDMARIKLDGSQQETLYKGIH